MKKLMKRIGAVLMAVAMMAALGVSAWATGNVQPDAPAGDTPAATTAYDTPLKVTNLTAGDVAHFYQVIKWVGETTDKSDVAGWKAVSPFDTILTKDKLTEVLVGTKAVPAVTDPETGEVTTPAVAAKDPTGITSELAGQLAAKATGDGTIVSELTDGAAVLNNTEAGMWLCLVTPKDANTVYNPVFVSSDYTAGGGTVDITSTGYTPEAVAKKSTLTLTKTASTTEDTWDDNKSDTTAVGDTVTFTVNTKIPGYGDVYEHPHFVLKDELNELKLKKDNDGKYIVSLTAPTGLRIKDATHSEAGTYDYEIVPTDTGYTITFAESYLKTVKTVTDVTVTYDAVVTADAATAVDEENNTVSIEYSHNPNNQSDYDVKKDTTQHYTFSIDAAGMGEGQTVSGKKTSEVVKIGVDASGNPINQRTETSAITGTETWSGPLEGAVFGLFTDKDGTVPYKGNGDTAVTASTGADGRMNFKGLDAGTYYLKEISAPAGYVTDSTVHKVDISATTKSVKVTEWYKDGAWSATDNGGKKVTYDTDILETYTVKIDGNEVATYNFKNAATANSTEIKWDEAETVEKPCQLKNTQGTSLPSTGGIGTYVFTVAGVAIMAIAAGLLVVRHKKKAE